MVTMDTIVHKALAEGQVSFAFPIPRVFIYSLINPFLFNASQLEILIHCILRLQISKAPIGL